MPVWNRRRRKRITADGAVVGIRVSGAPLALPAPSGDPLHILMGGQTGAGKSVMQRGFAGEVAARPDVAMVCLDPKRTALGLWSPRATVVAKTIDACTSTLVQLWREVHRRLDIMDAAGVDEWHPDLGGPFIVALIDELTEVVAPDGDKVAHLLAEAEDLLPGSPEFRAHAKALREALSAATQGQKAQGVFLTSLARICRSSGIQIVAATQYPESSVLDPQFRSNMTCRVMLRVASDEMVKVILGAGQTGDVTPDSISVEERGSCWVGGIESRPFRGRSYWVDTTDAKHRAADLAHLRWSPDAVFVGQPDRTPDDDQEEADVHGIEVPY